MLLQPLVTQFDSQKSTVAWVGSLLCGVYQLSGPLVGGLVNKFGCRPVCMMGAVLAWASFSLSSLSPNVPVLMVTYGLLGGLGLGLIYLPAIVSVGFYFERRRALATGEKQIYNQKLKMTKIYVSRYLGVRLRGRGLRDGSPSQVAGQHLRLGGQKECREFKY